MAALYTGVRPLRVRNPAEEDSMQDVVYMLVLVAFFALAGLFVVACDRIIGPDEAALAESSRGEPEPEPAPERMAA